MNTETSLIVVYEPCRPSGKWDGGTVQLSRKWAVARKSKVGYVVVSRFTTKEAAEKRAAA